MAGACSADAGRDLLAGPGPAGAERPATGFNRGSACRRPTVFYRALEQAANTAVIDALIAAWPGRLNALPIATSSLKEKVAAGIVTDLLDRSGPDVVLNATSFAVSQSGGAIVTPFDNADCPCLSGGVFRRVRSGLAGRDFGAFRPRYRHERGLPEVDGRLITRAVSFKAEARRHEATESWVLSYRPVPDRIAFVAALAARWARLRRNSGGVAAGGHRHGELPEPGRTAANGVGLDTPAGVVRTLHALAEAGYDVLICPLFGELMERVSAGVTND